MAGLAINHSLISYSFWFRSPWLFCVTKTNNQVFYYNDKEGQKSYL